MTSVVRAIKYRAGQLLVALITFGAFAGAVADDITGLNRFVCAPAQVTICDDDAFYLQGVERGRAFSFVINKSTGFMSAAIAREFLTVTGFGACTPSK